MAMNALAGIAQFIKGKGPGGVLIDNRLFQLHYRVTTTIFLGKAGDAEAEICNPCSLQESNTKLVLFG